MALVLVKGGVGVGGCVGVTVFVIDSRGVGIVILDLKSIDHAFCSFREC